ncbi:uncharacterized protein CMU_021830 [Cryptosporidium muris RN66]|uniref:Uncharacterized protein n=1 Tax=Cryptosporidium muris (strain RN66) TaxID=441375 RepID=B6AJM8_CRYMR|nr:uncharacterized protein CMU_021830 [Cryptosporidium muris RN66]EEA08419.1 hypothetical protein, conserved [Cryptosporidium muris RN66]|eukprot:XP_002142768.1 hypothetical protein [Cryptosporidium muris RN66]
MSFYTDKVLEILLLLQILLFTVKSHVKIDTKEYIKGPLQEENFNCKSLQSNEYKLALILRTICNEVLGELTVKEKIEYTREITIEDICFIINVLLRDFDMCENELITINPFMKVSYCNIEMRCTPHSIAYEICIRLKSEASKIPDFSELLSKSTKYFVKSHFTKNAIATINEVMDISLNEFQKVDGSVSSLTLYPQRDLNHLSDGQSAASSKSDVEFSFNVNVAPFMQCTNRQLIFTYYHPTDNAKCLGLNLDQLELVNQMQSLSVTTDNMKRIPRDLACTIIWMISQRWNNCSYVLSEMIDIKTKLAISFCNKLAEISPANCKYLVQNKNISTSFLTFKAVKLLRLIETTLRLNSEYFPEFEISAEDVANVIFIGNGREMIEENEEYILKALRDVRVSQGRQKSSVYGRNHVYNPIRTRYKQIPPYMEHESILDRITYGNPDLAQCDEKFINFDPLAMRQSEHWIDEKNMGSHEREYIGTRVRLLSYYIPPPSTFQPSDPYNWILGPCSWLEDKHKKLPNLIAAIATDRGYRLHILNACESIYALVHGSGESCSKVVTAALFLTTNKENIAEATDICSETSMRADIPFFRKESVREYNTGVNNHELYLVYQGIVLALCIELGISLDIDDINHIIFQDYPVNAHLVPRVLLNSLLYRALQLPSEFRTRSGFWNWPTQMHSTLSNAQAREILGYREVQLLFEQAQVQSEIMTIRQELLPYIFKETNLKSNTNPIKKKMQKSEIGEDHTPYNLTKSREYWDKYYEYEFLNVSDKDINPLRAHLVRLERLHLDLSMERQAIQRLNKVLLAYIGHKIHDIPKSSINRNFHPIYSPTVFRSNIAGNKRIVAGIATITAMRNVQNIFSSKSLSNNSDGDTSLSYNVKSKPFYTEIIECSSLTNKGLDFAYFVQNIANLHFELNISLGIACTIISHMNNNLPIDESFQLAAFAILSNHLQALDRNQIYSLWTFIKPGILSYGDQTLVTHDYKIHTSTESELDTSIIDLNDGQNYLNMQNSSMSSKNNFEISTPITPEVKRPRDQLVMNDALTIENVNEKSIKTILRDKENKEEDTSFRENKRIFRELKETVLQLDGRITSLKNKLELSETGNQSKYLQKTIRTLINKKNISIKRLIHLAGVISEKEVKKADKYNINIPNGIRRIAKLHQMRSIIEADILKLSDETIYPEKNKRIQELKAKLENIVGEIQHLIQLGGYIESDLRWYSDTERCLNNYIPRHNQVLSIEPTTGFGTLYWYKGQSSKKEIRTECTKSQRKRFKIISKDIYRLLSISLKFYPIPMSEFEQNNFINDSYIDPRQIIYWQNLLFLLNIQDISQGCNYSKTLLKKLLFSVSSNNFDYMDTPLFILWCADHIRSRLGNEDTWRNIVGLLWLIFFDQPIKPRELVEKNWGQSIRFY